MPLIISEEEREIIEKNIHEFYHWKLDEYKLEFIAEWDNERIPWIVAIPTKLRVDFSPKFIIMPDHSLITPRDPQAFEKIVATFYPKISKEDAKPLALLAIGFGRWDHSIGVLWTQNLEHYLPKNHIRQITEPILEQKGNIIHISFYTFEPELMRVSDCLLKIQTNHCEFNVKTYREGKTYD
jgi:hypothetical protein